VKAIFRRGTAYISLEQVQNAQDDLINGTRFGYDLIYLNFNQALQRTPKDKEIIKQIEALHNKMIYIRERNTQDLVRAVKNIRGKEDWINHLLLLFKTNTNLKAASTVIADYIENFGADGQVPRLPYDDPRCLEYMVHEVFEKSHSESLIFF
jgi:hypothetical protein